MSKRTRAILVLIFPLIIIIISLLAAVSVEILLTEQQQPIHAQVKQTFSSNSMLKEFLVPAGSRPHDVAPAADGTVWYTAQGLGELGRLDPNTGKTHSIALGKGSAPHGVIVGPDGAPWVTDGGLNAIVRVDARTHAVRRFPLPAAAGYANLNTATFDHRGVLWFTGQSGVYGSVDPRSGRVRVFRTDP